MHTQEDMPVSHLTPLNGDAADDGRFTIHLRQPTRYAHFSGESLRHVEVTNVLSTRFVVSWEESYLFEAWLRGPDVPNLHSALPVMITTANASLAGFNALGNAAGRALRGTSVAIFGWAAFSVEASALAADLNLHFANVHLRGGHFAFYEAPDACVADIRAMFRDLRPGGGEG